MSIRTWLRVLTTATTALVVVVFLAPLGLVVRGIAAQHAVDTATTRAQTLTVLIATGNHDALQSGVDQLNAAGAEPVTVYLPDGSRLGAAAARTPAVQLASRGRSFTVAEDAGREILLAVAGLPDGIAVIRTFVANAELRAGVGRAWLILGLLAAAMVAVAAYVVDRLARAVVQSITDLAVVSRALAGGELDARAGTVGPSEVREVSHALNRLAGRIQDMIRQERETAADLSHRLRTPLAALRMEVDTLTATAPSTVPAQRLRAQVGALQTAVSNLIHDARYRADREPARADATAVVTDRVEFWGVLAAEQGRPLSVDLPSRALPVGVAPASLAACLDALLGNVFAHTPDGTPFAIGLRPDGFGARIEIADQGPGFGANDPSLRGVSGSGSTGLGLDIARQAARTSGGDLTLRSSPRGAIVTVTLGPPR